MPVFIVTGTDTGVGKTTVACGIARALRRLGADVGVFKPFSTGGRDDARALKEAADVADTLDEINPCHLSAPAAPLRAAELDHTTIDLAACLDAFDVLRHRHDVLLVEGVGGLLVPLREEHGAVSSFRDFCADLAGDLLIVARRTLGTLNHSWLTIEACRAAGLAVRGVVFNDAVAVAGGEPESSAPALLARCAQVQVLACIPFGAQAEAFTALAATLVNDPLPQPRP